MDTSVTCRYFDTSQLIRSNDVACIVSLPTTVLALVEGHCRCVHGTFIQYCYGNTRGLKLGRLSICVIVTYPCGCHGA